VTDASSGVTVPRMRILVLCTSPKSFGESTMTSASGVGADVAVEERSRNRRRF
jgi:hypothetical protein